MTILLLKGYNNYFNRIKKSESSISAYKTASTSYLEYTNVNFDYQDGILTSLVVGSSQQQVIVPPATEGADPTYKPIDWDESGSPDYLIVHESNVIKSRWFILEVVKIRGGQYKLALKRDVLVDFSEQIMNSPCFIEKGSINDVNNPLLLNSEGMSFNQQKQDETILRDSTNCAWLVGYLKKDMNSSQTVTYAFPDEPSGLSDLDSKEWANCVKFRNLDGTETSPLKTAAVYDDYNSTMKYRVWYPSAKTLGWVNPKNIRLTIGLAGGKYDATVDQANSDWAGLTSTALDLEEHGLSNVSIGIAENEARQLAKEIYEHTFNWSYVNGFFNTLVASAKYTITTGNNLVIATEDLSQYNNKMFTYNNKVYKLTVGQGTEKTYDQYYTGQDNICNDYLSALYYEPFSHRYLYRNQDNPTRRKVRLTLKYREYNITATEIPFGTMEYTLPAPSQRNQCVDAMYDMFAMPVSPNAFGLPSADTNLAVVTPGADTSGSGDGTGIIYIDFSSEYQLAMAAELATKFGAGTSAGYIYDLQLLPYCPFSFGEDALYYENHIYGPVYGRNVILLDELNSKDYSIINRHDIVEGQTVDIPVGVVFYPTKANFAVGIDYNNPDETVHEEWLTIEKPVLLSQGREGDYTRWRFSDFPYEVTDGTWDIGPNPNNPNVDVILSDGLTNEDCSYLVLQVSPNSLGGYRPALNIASADLPLQPADDVSTRYTANFKISVRAHWVKPDNSLDKKLKNECDFYRLTSPNYNSFYEFKKTKLAGGINGLNVVCTYKPYTPYIKINPNLNNSLYSSKDYNDSIGLVLSGDYSMPMMSDALINYELQNRNYQAIFNRQLVNLDVNNRIAAEQQQWQGVMSMIGSPVTGGAGGAVAGAKGGPWGAIIGAAAGAATGGITTGIGYAKDKNWLLEQQAEVRDFAVDNFNYQLGNIQALPQTMTKSTPLSYNNKVWPILEYFSCTDTEKEVLRNKLKYDGMTIMAIGQIKDYVDNGSFVKGKMIRFNDLGDDSHIANAIYEEVQKGFYEGE